MRGRCPPGVSHAPQGEFAAVPRARRKPYSTSIQVGRGTGCTLRASEMTPDRITPLSTVREDLGPPAPVAPLEFAVLGIGGGGCNALNRVAGPGVLPTPHLFALNTDAQH